MNAVEIEHALSEYALQPFDRDDFPFAFLAAFGNKDVTIKRLRKGDTNASDVPGGLLQRNNIHIAVCQAGYVPATLKALRESPKTIQAKAKFILVTDGEILDTSVPIIRQCSNPDSLFAFHARPCPRAVCLNDQERVTRHE